LTLSGRGVVKQRPSPAGARAGRKVTGKGTVRLKIRAKGKARRRLLHRGRAKVRYKVTFTPAGGSANSQSQSLTLVKRRPHAR
jgi:hypothetical protein